MKYADCHGRLYAKACIACALFCLGTVKGYEAQISRDDEEERPEMRGYRPSGMRECVDRKIWGWGLQGRDMGKRGVLCEMHLYLT